MVRHCSRQVRLPTSSTCTPTDHPNCRKGAIPENFRPVYEKLVSIRNELEKLSITQAWSLRETDLYDYQRELDKIDESRVNGNFIDEDGNPADLYAQRTLLYLIRRSYGYIYYLMISSEPVSEALLPYYNQLQTLKRCLVEVKNSGGVSTVRDLYPYSMKVSSSAGGIGESKSNMWYSSTPSTTCGWTASSWWATTSPRGRGV